VGVGPNSIAALELLGLGKMFEQIADFIEPNSIWMKCADHTNGEVMREVGTFIRFGVVLLAHR
jgi:hypothetical protein